VSRMAETTSFASSHFFLASQTVERKLLQDALEILLKDSDLTRGDMVVVLVD
jgi:hypothetical protein